MKMKEIGPRGAHFPSTPLDPPLIWGRGVMGVGIGHLFSEFPTNTMQAKLIFLSCKIHFTGQFCDSSFVLIFKEELIFSEFLQSQLTTSSRLTVSPTYTG